MKGLFKVKLKRKKEAHFWGIKGNREAQPWGLIIDIIAKEGVENVEYVRYDDRDATPANQKQLSGKEMLMLWKAVDKRKVEINSDTT